jgi:hypothetical protein
LPLLAEDHRMDVAAWLRDLGLERYVSAFRDNDIDAEVLPKLTAEDLISIGVTSVGHRRKLIEAIAGLGTAVPTAVVAAPAPGARAQVDAERRQLTVISSSLPTWRGRRSASRSSTTTAAPASSGSSRARARSGIASRGLHSMPE